MELLLCRLECLLHLLDVLVRIVAVIVLVIVDLNDLFVLLSVLIISFFVLVEDIGSCFEIVGGGFVLGHLYVCLFHGSLEARGATLRTLNLLLLCVQAFTLERIPDLQSRVETFSMPQESWRIALVRTFVVL